MVDSQLQEQAPVGFWSSFINYTISLLVYEKEKDCFISNLFLYLLIYFVKNDGHIIIIQDIISDQFTCEA